MIETVVKYFSSLIMKCFILIILRARATVIDVEESWRLYHEDYSFIGFYPYSKALEI